MNKDFVERSEWIRGPDFLKEPVESWLTEESYDEQVDSDSPGVKNVEVDISAVKETSDILKRRFSSWFKAKMAVALCLKYKRPLRDRDLAKFIRNVMNALIREHGIVVWMKTH